MKRFAAALTLALAAVTGGCAATVETPATPVAAAPAVVAEAREPVTLMVSIDGFHPSYLERGLTPTLTRLAQTGTTATMWPSFPSKTFPNHWTLVTGLVPDHHGIVANRFEDSTKPDEVFTMATLDPFWWGEAKPIWVEAEEAGIRSAAMFWPGSAVPWGGTAQDYGPVEDGVLPSDWQQFSMQVSNTQRVNAVLDWMRRPAAIRPEFVLLYFDTVDSAGHDGGPEGEAIDAALRDVDRHVADLVEGLEAMNQPVNLVIVSDHGMDATSSDRVIALDTVLDPSLYRLVEGGAYATFEPTEGNRNALETALLRDHEHMECWRREDIPARFEYGSNPRIPPYLCLAEAGWTIVPKTPDNAWSGGSHGYDPFDPTMASLFIANGPAFASGAMIEPFRNTGVAPLLRHLIGLPPAARADGSLGDTSTALRTRAD